MYTRFKSQKSGVKLSMNSLSNTNRARVVVAAVATSVSCPHPPTSSSGGVSLMLGLAGSSIHASSASSTSAVSLSSSSSSQSLNCSQHMPDSSSPTTTTTTANSSRSSSTITPSLASSIILNADFDFNWGSDYLPSGGGAGGDGSGELLRNAPTTFIPLQIDENGVNLKSSSASNKKSSASKTNHNSSTSRKEPTGIKLVETIEEPVDFNCITYVRSKWEKVKSEIGTEDGPQRHVIDESSQYPHLSNFVAFDIENWWTERVFSSMINDKPTTTKATTATTTNNLNFNLSQKQQTAATSVPFNSTSPADKIDTSFLLNGSRISAVSFGQKQPRVSREPFDSINTRKQLNSIAPASLRSFNNFQMCFS